MSNSKEQSEIQENSSSNLLNDMKHPFSKNNNSVNDVTYKKRQVNDFPQLYVECDPVKTNFNILNTLKSNYISFKIFRKCVLTVEILEIVKKFHVITYFS